MSFGGRGRGFIQFDRLVIMYKFISQSYAIYLYVASVV